MGPKFRTMIASLLEQSAQDGVGNGDTVVEATVVKSGTKLDVELEWDGRVNHATMMLTYVSIVLAATQHAIDLGAKVGTPRDEVLIMLGFKDG